MDPLDPLTEIINSGQAFSPVIALERIIWAIIGVFFLIAISKSIKITILNKNSYPNKTNSHFFNFINKEKEKEKEKDKENENENENTK